MDCRRSFSRSTVCERGEGRGGEGRRREERKDTDESDGAISSPRICPKPHHCEQVLILHYESHTSPLILPYDSKVGGSNVCLGG